jgi:hypothetical protein
MQDSVFIIGAACTTQRQLFRARIARKRHSGAAPDCAKRNPGYAHHRSDGLQSGRTSAPIRPHRMQTIREQSERTGVSSGSESALNPLLW